jgi:hypothetical protein
MSNASTVRRQVSGTQQLTLASLSGTVITTIASPFVLNNNALTGVGGGLVPLAAGNTGLYLGTGQVMHIAVAGSYSGATAASTTLEIELIQITAAGLAAATINTLAGQQAAVTAAGSTKIADSGALQVAQAAGSFTLDAYVQLDAAGNLEGNFTAQIDSATTAALQKLSSVPTGLAEIDLNFFAVAVLGVAETGVVVTVNEIRLDLE